MCVCHKSNVQNIMIGGEGCVVSPTSSCGPATGGGAHSRTFSQGLDSLGLWSLERGQRSQDSGVPWPGPFMAHGERSDGDGDVCTGERSTRTLEMDGFIGYDFGKANLVIDV